MEGKDNKLTPEDIDELRKSLSDLGFTDDEVEENIQKAIGEEKGEKGEQHKIEDEAKKEGETVTEEKREFEKDEKSPVAAKKDKEEDKKEIEKSNDNDEDDIEKKKEMYKSMKAKHEAICKSMQEFEDQFGTLLGSAAASKEKPTEDLKKSIDNDIEKSMADMFTEKFSDFEKSIVDKIGNIEAQVKKIGDTPIPTKSQIIAANFIEKGQNSDFGEGGREMSISRDKDMLIKSMEDFIEKSTDNDLKEMVSDGLSEFTINHKVTDNAAKALATISRAKNIKLIQ